VSDILGDEAPQLRVGEPSKPVAEPPKPVIARPIDPPKPNGTRAIAPPPQAKVFFLSLLMYFSLLHFIFFFEISIYSCSACSLELGVQLMRFKRFSFLHSHNVDGDCYQQYCFFPGTFRTDKGGKYSEFN
jgi:hypothetical protein